MGWCDVVRSPCAYVTVLREPIERLLSLHAYSCVLGSEAKAGWSDAMKKRASASWTRRRTSRNSEAWMFPYSC